MPNFCRHLLSSFDHYLPIILHLPSSSCLSLLRLLPLHDATLVTLFTTYSGSPRCFGSKPVGCGPWWRRLWRCGRRHGRRCSRGGGGRLTTQRRRWRWRRRWRGRGRSRRRRCRRRRRGRTWRRRRARRCFVDAGDANSQ